MEGNSVKNAFASLVRKVFSLKDKNLLLRSLFFLLKEDLKSVVVNRKVAMKLEKLSPFEKD